MNKTILLLLSTICASHSVHATHLSTRPVAIESIKTNTAHFDKAIDLNDGVTQKPILLNANESIQIHLPKQTDSNKCYLFLDWPFIHQVSILASNNEKQESPLYQEEESDFKTRLTMDRRFLVPLNYRESSSQTMSALVVGNSFIPSIISPKIVSSTDAMQIRSNHGWFLGLFFGSMASLMLFSLIIFIHSKNISFFLYFAFIASLIIDRLSANGIIIPSGTKEAINMTYVLIPIVVLHGSVWMHIMSLHLLQVINLKLRQLYNVLFGVVCFYFLFGIAIYFSELQSKVFVPLQAILTLTMVFYLIVAIIKAIRGRRFAVTYLVGLAALIMGSIIFNLSMYVSQLSDSFFARRGLELGGVLFSSIVFYGLVQDLKDFATALEVKVKEQTTIIEKKQGQIVEQSNLAKLGQVAATISHEIGNPTGAIRNTLGPISKCVAEIPKEYINPKLIAAMDIIKESTNRIDEIVKSIRLNTGQRLQSLKSVNIQEVIMSVIQMTNNYVLERNVNVECTMSEPVFVKGDPGGLHRVFTNLITNAVDAMPNGGDVQLASRVIGKNVEISVVDTGTGIPEEIRSKIFDRFYTTKEVGKGTGLGLSLAKEEIEEIHQGSIKVESELGKGTTFIVSLPVLLEEARKTT